MILLRTTLLLSIAAGALVACGDSRVARLEQRISELEAQQRDHEQLVSEALDQTATQLEQFLVRMARLQGIELPAEEPEQDGGEPVRPTGNSIPARSQRPDTTPSPLGPWWWLMPLLVSGLVGALYWWRSYRRDREDWRDAMRPSTSRPPVSREAVQPLVSTSQSVEFRSPVVIEPPEPNGSGPAPLLVGDPPLEFFDPPAAVRQEFAHSDPANLMPAVSRWLCDDPRILLEPAPALETDGGLVRVHYHLAPGVTVEETEEIEREVARLAIEPDRLGGSQGTRQVKA